MKGLPPTGGWLDGDSLAAALFREATEALFLVDPLSERVLDANPAARRLSGLGDDDLLGASVRALLLHEQGWQDWLTPLLLASPAQAAGDLLLRTGQSDRPVPVRVFFARLERTGGPPLALFTLRDRRPEADLLRRTQRAEGELRRVLVSVREGLWSCRLEAGGRSYRYLSPAVERITGRPVNAFVEDADLWQRVVEPDDLPRWQAFQARLAAGFSAELTYRLRRPDGALVHVRENVLVAPDDAGLLLYGVLTDAGMAEAAAAPASGLDGLARLAGALSHDFSNLITGVLGHVSLAQMPGGDTPDALRQIETIAHRAAELCRQLALVAGKGKGGNLPQDVNVLVQAAAAEQAVALPAGPPLLLDLADDLPPAPGDPSLLRAAVSNLLSNAVEALGGAAGRVVLRTRPAPRPWPPVGPAAFDFSDPADRTSGVCLEVRDDGPGVAADVLPRLFEPFVTTRPGRRGLGLAVVLGIVRAHRGAVHVDSTPGKGTSVRVYLPAPLAAVAPTPVGRPSSASGAVLLADDEEGVLAVAGRLLDSLGCRVLHAADGRQALEVFARHAGEVRLALLDLTMPPLGGDTVARELLRRAPGLPVVLMSGYPEPEAVAHLGDLPLAGYLQKPFRLSALAELLGRLLPS